ncbi:hypothetical protein PHYBLDRAFT_153571 [Phycomyces blakesleeanus NRRL 1555(-)]|uniref:Uncharacterized protein n=1 Tax=Phycomyces blakesleeanus (strain ATCC 8743b / DSM 1359 / FGSC 10004 / NBRC 33097 / NRRL 1555) TaxID=763407 RepID=A0A167J6X4_PHYB8|nr:hypothetical protein PHYBLDRAFT_153571 [Phycomyces blakesleeanus NRRL 1555(-)]OAD65327.1 hypothetical protein PHYBLDRAFT_153571 [Phycomyces blakesleeanus NRRL 1555(-)]|eukprot:XP_018283367.1 hypothetical protein PHYBLDRAFT_153571 [Phycomyces blakesleeanus NRRL 1555(-)]
MPEKIYHEPCRQDGHQSPEKMHQKPELFSGSEKSQQRVARSSILKLMGSVGPQLAAIASWMGEKLEEVRYKCDAVEEVKSGKLHYYRETKVQYWQKARESLEEGESSAIEELIVDDQDQSGPNRLICVADREAASQGYQNPVTETSEYECEWQQRKIAVQESRIAYAILS